jgi:hypothetical protein
VRIDRLEMPDASDGLVDRQPGLQAGHAAPPGRLSHGHPSSPYREDGSDWP